MSFGLVIISLLGGVAILVLKSLAVDQLRGYVKQRILASLEATIHALPPELQAEWADEWRAEMAAAIEMPLSAALLARGISNSGQRLAEGLVACQRLAEHASDSRLRRAVRRLHSSPRASAAAMGCITIGAGLSAGSAVALFGDASAPIVLMITTSTGWVLMGVVAWPMLSKVTATRSIAQSLWRRVTGR